MSRRIGASFRALVALVISGVMLFPVVATAVNGLKNSGQLLVNPFGLPSPPQWANYTGILTGDSFWRMLWNSVVVMVGTVVLSLLAASMAAFVLARVPFAGRRLLFRYLNMGLLFPITVAVLPLYLLLRNVGLLDNLWGVVLPQVAFSLPMNTLIIRDFMRSLPNELQEAAIIDGCSWFTLFWRIVLPLSQPVLAAVAALTMVSSWNAFLLPLLVINTESKWTLPLGMMQFQGQYSTEWGLVMAFVTLGILPTIGFYLLAQRHLISGLTAGALKE
ncbi:MAG: thiamine ABC transporter ATP-binding protein [Bacillota bacterium]|nr:MAG: thiamine ABC transporter ATP-binding protein [Bacillota bacterium]